jgi:hypothetical protein
MMLNYFNKPNNINYNINYDINYNMKYRIIFITVLFIIITITCASQAGAVAISVNKAVMDFKGVLRGGYAEDTIYIASDTELDSPINYEAMGDIKEWISFEPDINNNNATIYVNRNHPQALKVIIQPPADLAQGNYTGSFRVITGALNSPEGPYGSQLQAAFLIRINLEIIGDQILSCAMGGIIIANTELGKPIEVGISISNQGNVRVIPELSIDIWNQDQTKIILSQTNLFSIPTLPTTSRSYTYSLETPLRIGQYWAYLSSKPCGNSELISFNIVEKGTISDSGELLRIENRPWANTGEIIPITAFFRNSGPRIVSAKFKGIITLDNRIVENIESDFYDIHPEEIMNITVFFTPKKPGQYYISGRVLYNNKLSYEKSSIINVNGITIDASPANTTYVLLLIIILIGILVLLIIIRNKRNRRRHL